MDTFRVALSGDFLKADGSLAYPSMDLGPLDSDPRIEYAFLTDYPKYERAPTAFVRPQDLAEFDVYVMYSLRFTQESCKAADRLALVSRFGVGYDNVDIGACADAGVAVTIATDAVRRPMATVLVTLILAATSKLLIKDRIVRAGPARWLSHMDHVGFGLTGRTLGMIGVGNIGGEAVKLLKPFDLEIVAYDPYADPEKIAALGIRLADLEEVFRSADILAVCCALTEETRHLVDAERLALMKPTAFLVNIARGPIVDQDALVEALAAGRLAGAGLDVLEREPPEADEPILGLDNVVLSPHTLGTTDECMRNIFAECVGAAIDVMHGNVPRSVVNRRVLDDDRWQAKLAGYRRRFGAREVRA